MLRQKDEYINKYKELTVKKKQTKSKDMQVISDEIKDIISKATPTKESKSESLTVIGDEEEPWTAKQRKIVINTKPVEQWNHKDILQYFKSIYFTRLHVPVENASLPVVYSWINEINSSLSATMRLSGIRLFRPVLVKSYIDWVFEKWSDGLVRKYGNFHLKHLKEVKAIARFCQTYNPSKSQVIQVRDDVISLEEVQDCFSINSTVFLQRFGWVIPIIFLINKKNQTEKTACNYVINECKKLIKNNRINEVWDATKNYEPYPENVKRIIKQVCEEVNFPEVKIGENNNFRNII